MRLRVKCENGTTFVVSAFDVRTGRPRNTKPGVIACFAGDGLVELADGTHKRVDELRAGDTLRPASAYPNSTPEAASPKDPLRVKYLVKIRLTDPKTHHVCVINGLRISRRHPIRFAESSAWELPLAHKFSKSAAEEGLSHIYNIVLESGHVARINGVDVITLGHGIRDIQELVHPLYSRAAFVGALLQQGLLSPAGVIHIAYPQPL